jgi:hypothetical protein
LAHWSKDDLLHLVILLGKLKELELDKHLRSWNQKTRHMRPFEHGRRIRIPYYLVFDIATCKCCTMETAFETWFYEKYNIRGEKFIKAILFVLRLQKLKLADDIELEMVRSPIWLLLSPNKY